MTEFLTIFFLYISISHGLSYCAKKSLKFLLRETHYLVLLHSWKKQGGSPKRLPPDNTVMKNAQKAPTKLELSKKANLTPYIFQVQKLPVPLHHALQYKDQFHALQRIPGVFQRSYQSFHFFCPYHSAVHPQKSW